MKSYLVMKLNSGKFAILEKRSKCIVEKGFQTWNDATDRLKEIKEADKAAVLEKKILKQEVEKAIHQNASKFVFEGSSAILRSYTKSGKQVTLISNNGLELRSRKCYTLYIDNECIFTSGTIQAAMEYMIKN